MKHANLQINGKVQGVFLRERTKNKAKELGLIGFVRNEEDGSVYAEVEGEETLIEDLVKWLQNGGVELATVEKIVVDYEDKLKVFTDFSIRS